MCGISGFFKFSKDLSEDDLKKFGLDMSKKLQRRGPDSFGVWVDKRVGLSLSHRRLSIIDLSPSGNQPMISSNDRYVLTYNGEVYNYLEIAKQLNDKNISFKTHSDTEVILEAITHWGLKKSLGIFNGMFAFSLWDKKLQTLFLVRDRLGIKPLYWYSNEHNFAFASELKAFKVLPWIAFDLDSESISSYVRLNYIPSPFSIFKKIFKIEPGTFLEINAKKKIVIKKYWSLETKLEQNLTIGTLNNEKIIEDDLDLSVKTQMRSDVPLGVFLSGGIDSSLIASLAQKNSKKKIQTFTIGFKDTEFNEANYAKKIANFLNTNHHEEFFEYSELGKLVDNLGEIYDEPFSDSSQLPTLLLSQITRKKVKVALSGDGADELFGGYYRYFLAEKYKKLIYKQPELFKYIISKIINTIPISLWNCIGIFMPNKYGGKQLGDKLYKLSILIKDSDEVSFHKRIISNINDPLNYVHSEKEKKIILFEKNLEKLFPNIIERMQLVDTLTYLPDDILTKVDRASMFNSLEVRVPFLDNRVVESSWRLKLEKKVKKDEGKIILKNILKKYLPHELFTRPKMGFGIPLNNIIKTELNSIIEHFIFSTESKNQNIFKIFEYQKKWEEHMSGKRNWQFLLWNFLVFQVWFEEWRK